MKFDVQKFNEAQVEICRMRLENHPDSQTAKDCMAYWLNESGQKEEALKYASEEMKTKINGKQ